MKTLAIFGDSFAAHDPVRRNSIPFCWTNRINRLKYSVTVYAEPCTSFYWTYRNFLEHHEQFDHIVCIVTRPGRVTIRHAPYFLGIPLSGNSLKQCQYLLEQTRQRPTEHERKTIQAIHDFFYYVQDQDYEVEANSLLLDRLRALRPDAIFIPIGTGLPNLQFPEYPMMSQITEMMVRSLKPEMIDEYFSNGGWIHNQEKTTIQCHMTIEANQLMAQLVEEALDKGVWAPHIPQTIPHNYTWEDYYEPYSNFAFMKVKKD